MKKCERHASKVEEVHAEENDIVLQLVPGGVASQCWVEGSSTEVQQ